MENYLLIIKDEFQTSFPPKEFNKKTVILKKITEDQISLFLFNKVTAPSDWRNFGFAWVAGNEMIVNLKKYKKNGHKNNMSKIWKKFVSYENIVKLLRKEKLKNI